MIIVKSSSFSRSCKTSRHGKGANSKASLNLADCAAYALAKTMRAPLLFKGDDFTHTELARFGIEPVFQGKKHLARVHCPHSLSARGHVERSLPPAWPFFAWGVCLQRPVPALRWVAQNLGARLPHGALMARCGVEIPSTQI